ncbi:MAG TPA: hypothetical protein VKY32_04975 [Flavobacterium sp.]|nr:hypothetical protein [Flavobacterium sp.]
MRNYRNYIFILISSLLFTSCDKFSVYSIQNSSNDKLIVKAKISENHINKKNREKSLFFGIENMKVISTDTINNVITFILPQDYSYDLDGCTNCQLNFEFIQEIKVYKKDSLVFYGNKEIIKNLYKNTDIKANKGVFHIY